MLMLTDTQKAMLAITIVDAKGNPAVVDGAPEWSTSDASVLSVQPAADGMSAIVRASGGLGSAQVSVTADADTGAGIEPIAGTLDVEVIAGKAVAVSISAGAPDEQ